MSASRQGAWVLERSRGEGGSGGARSLRPLGRWAVRAPFRLLQPSPALIGGQLAGGALAVSLGAAASPTFPLQDTVRVRGEG